jgi:hypothetical protein
MANYISTHTGAEIDAAVDMIGNIAKYSYDEQAVGTWVDGSTIYKKTFHSGAVQHEGEYAIPKEAGWHIGMYIKSEVIMRYTDSTYDLIWASNMGNENMAVSTEYDANSGIVTFYFRNPHAYMDSYVTIYYTKVDDA